MNEITTIVMCKGENESIICPLRSRCLRYDTVPGIDYLRKLPYNSLLETCDKMIEKSTTDYLVNKYK